MYSIVLLKTEQHPMDISACPPAHRTANTQPSYSVRHFSDVALVELQDASAKLVVTSKVSPLPSEKVMGERDWSTNVNIKCV